MSDIDISGGLPKLRDLSRHFLSGVPVPKVGLVRQRFEPPVEEDPETAALMQTLDLIDRSGRRPGPIAVGVGSRGIANLAALLRGTVRALRERGFQPFIVPAMGSHGGATAEAQAELLAGYGVTERSIGVPVRATMETVRLGEVDGVEVHFDRHAHQAGSVILVCRVKPHTDFMGSIESGAAKMLAIGLGKQRGAMAIHSVGLRGMTEVIPRAARIAIERGLVLGAVCAVENQRDQTAHVRGLIDSEIGGGEESRLLEEAYRLMPRVPFAQLDALVVEQMGKNISGAGMDSNVLNRFRIPGLPEPEGLRVTNVAVLRLTPETHGNATGIGLAEFITAKLLGEIDLTPFYMNSLTAGVTALERTRLPVVMPTERDAVLAAAHFRGKLGNEPLRLAWIQDTLHTELIGVSEALWEEARDRPDLEVLTGLAEMPFDADGNLAPIAAQITQR